MLFFYLLVLVQRHLGDIQVVRLHLILFSSLLVLHFDDLIHNQDDNDEDGEDKVLFFLSGHWGRNWQLIKDFSIWI